MMIKKQIAVNIVVCILGKLLRKHVIRWERDGDCRLTMSGEKWLNVMVVFVGILRMMASRLTRLCEKEVTLNLMSCWAVAATPMASTLALMPMVFTGAQRKAKLVKRGFTTLAEDLRY